MCPPEALGLDADALEPPAAAPSAPRSGPPTSAWTSAMFLEDDDEERELTDSPSTPALGPAMKYEVSSPG